MLSVVVAEVCRKFSPPLAAPLSTSNGDDAGLPSAFSLAPPFGREYFSTATDASSPRCFSLRKKWNFIMELFEMH